ncbi:DUF1080 domain-containing protein [Mucilaginibacter gynuensis]|uniref:DUF1080 domain-containing protein n=1 Tax=Mucilaginibacter gynuensis TaxID=1302236 RepID=A0ABP8FR89_9SPHI
MKAIFTCTLCLVCLLCTSFVTDTGWTHLLDKNLSKWGMYLSYRHKLGYKGEVPKDAKGSPLKPIGYNKNEAKVFTVTEVNGEPVLRISGEIYGCVYTKQEFSNYHLKLMVKWGDKKWVPRLNEPKDSGVIYHSQGPAGVDYWHAWMLGQELQVMEAGCGDYWCIASSAAKIRTLNTAAKKDTLVYSPKGKITIMGSGNNFVQQSHNYEKPSGQWNLIELICFGDKSIHIVNGHVVMAISGSTYKDGDQLKPLVKGKLQLQSEAAEVFYKQVMIKPIDKVPAQYTAYF